MDQVATIVFDEPGTDAECLVIIRAGKGQVALALSRRESSDTEVVLPAALALQVADALREGAQAV